MVMKNALISVIILIILLVVPYKYDIPVYYSYFGLGIVYLISELIYVRLFKKRITGEHIFILKSNVWIGSFLAMVSIIYVFSLQPHNVWTITAMILLALSALSKMNRERKAYYQVTSEGVWNLHTQEHFIKPDQITGIRISQEEIAIDTIEYTNHLKAKPKQLKSPTWDELTKRFFELKEVWLKEEVQSEQ